MGLTLKLPSNKDNKLQHLLVVKATLAPSIQIIDVAPFGGFKEQHVSDIPLLPGNVKMAQRPPNPPPATINLLLVVPPA